MENLDFIILTAVVVVVFAIFSISLIKGIVSKDDVKGSGIRIDK